MLGEATLRASLGSALAVLGAVGAIAAGSFTASASAADSFTVSKSVAHTATSVPTALSLKANPATETYGKPATVTGTLSTGGSTSAPVAGQKVWVSTTKTSAGALATGTTTASGGFSVKLPERAAGGTLYAGSAAAKGLAGTVVPLTLKVVHPTQIGSLKVSLSQYWKVSVSGCLGFPGGDKTERIAHTTGLTVEYKASGGFWNKLAVINGKESDVRCGTGGIKFTGTFGAKLSSADYRVVYAGTTGVTSYAPATSATILAWRYDTRITGFTLSPTVVNAGGKVTIKGTLQYLNKSWLNFGGQPLVVGLLRTGSTKWTWPVVVKTNAAGQFSATIKVPYSATWQIRFNGDTTKGGHLSAWTPQIKVTLK
jgi:hypothetical protein